MKRDKYMGMDVHQATTVVAKIYSTYTAGTSRGPHALGWRGQSICSMRASKPRSAISAYQP
jgi:hypothetical protein